MAAMEATGADGACAGAGMPGAEAIDGETLQAVRFVGEALAPLFLEEPLRGSAEAQLDMLATVDGRAFADGWPFALEADVLCAVDLMHRGLAQPREDVMWEFRRLFVGPGALVVPPWGSTYLDRDGVVFGDSHTQLVAFMRANGIIRLADEHTPVDHIGLMLHLMAWIAGNRSAKLREYVAKHLFTWSSHYLDELQGRSTSGFYQGLALLTRSTLAGIQEVLAIEVEYPRYVR